MTSNLLTYAHKVINRLHIQTYLFGATSLFYIVLWLANPNNKIIVASFIGLIGIYYIRLKNLNISLILAYLASTIIATGKRYTFLILDSPLISPIIFPDGYLMHITISPKHVLAFIAVLILIRNQIINPKSQLKHQDLLVIGLYLWTIMTDYLTSPRPDISLLISMSALHTLAVYLLIRIQSFTRPLWSFALPIVLSLILFQSSISFLQLLSGSPIYKQLEAMVNIEYFGHTADELAFRFRPVGTFDHANGLGAWLSLHLLILAGLLLSSPTSNTLKLTSLAGAITLIFTLSRSSWLGLSLGFIFLLFMLKKCKLLHVRPNLINFKPLVLLALPLCVFFILPRAIQTVESYGRYSGGGYFREKQIETTIKLITNHSLLGVGSGMSVLQSINEYPASVFSYTPLMVHHFPLLYTAEQGLIALIILSLIIIKIVTKLLRKPIQLGLAGGIIAMLIVGLFQPFMLVEYVIIYSAIVMNRNL
jgi:hypothetical protein